MTRIEPPAPPYDAHIAESLAKWTPPDWPGEPPLIFRIFHVHPELASRARVLGAGFLAHGQLPERDRELIIDRITGRHGAAHEWGLHATYYGPRVALTDVQLDSTVTGPHSAPQLWTDAELELFDAVDELCDTTDLTDTSWQRVRARYNDQQLLELIVLVGWYRTVASICNTLRLPQDSTSRPFPCDRS